MAKARNYCFTINVETWEDWVPPIQWDPKIKCCIAQTEVGEEGTFHWQGYVELTTPMRMNAVKALFGCDWMHLEVRRGTRAQAIEYCRKDDGTRAVQGYQLIEHGDLTAGQGRRNDLLVVKKKLDQGKSMLEVATDDECFASVVRYNRGIQLYKQLITPPRRIKTRVSIYYGEPGTGKSHAAHTAMGERFGERGYYTKTGAHKWWNGYDGHKGVIMEDMDPAHEYYRKDLQGTILTLWDKWPAKVETKGGMEEFVAEWIIVTTNFHPGDVKNPWCYDWRVGRRVDEWKEFTEVYVPPANTNAVVMVLDEEEEDENFFFVE